MTTENNLISNWLDVNGEPEIEAFVEKNLAITEKVRQALEAKGWSHAEFAKAMGKSPSEVSKWLSGMHNLTLKSIIKMETALGMDLFHCEPTKEYEYVFLGMISNAGELSQKNADYIAAAEMSEYAVAM